MNQATARQVRLRATLLWILVTAGLAGLGTLTAPSVRRLVSAPGPGFAELLVQACAAAALVAGGVLWLATTEVVAGVLRAPAGRSGRAGRPVGPVRLALLAACGCTVLATTPAHARADPGPGDGPLGSGALHAATALGADALSGLPLPDRPVGQRPARPRDTRPVAVTVRPGDSLWTIAARRLGPDASRAEVTSYWQRVRALNADALGPDPDLIRPGQTVRLPPA
ncbi:LysM peptidoglycan-binding domain-containing protein [Nocardioides nitrophenolicus]|uniref:LysM peptidoglycan-binding domain-containing protein n=1 Tax=Nocardioides nitrophenolicus TaxID=60489 RepID=UPI00195E5CC4|nr:LysM domain-containing protein [Nocardioides nitrophenolicus]MBM7515866.1 nucleoid-associated protein YgaU [Nocardioides nitrophenolicus]